MARLPCTPSSNAFGMLAHARAVGASALRLVLTLLTETVPDPGLRELVIMRVVQRSNGRYAWTQHVAIARTVGVSEAQITSLEIGASPSSPVYRQPAYGVRVCRRSSGHLRLYGRHLRCGAPKLLAT
jgi:hypothetical protein